MRILNPYDKILCLFFLMAPLSVCTIVFGGVGIVSYFTVAFAAFIYLINQKLKVDKRIIALCLLFFLPILLSYVFSYVNFFIFDNNQYENYFLADMPVRLVNCLVFFIIFVFGHTCIVNSPTDRLKVDLKWYIYGVVFFLGIFGIWQILNMLFGIWMPSIGTRVNIHSMAEGSSFDGFFRVTSLANEPSYLVPFLLDAILLCLYLKKKILVSLLSIILLFSLSLGGYTNGFILFCCAVYLFRSKISLKKYFLYILVISPFLLFLFWEEFSFLFNIVMSRQELSGDFSMGDSGRIQMVVLPWVYLLDGNFISVLFGNGPGSFKFLSMTKQMDNGDIFHSTSNCLYTDIAYEGGVLAIIGIILFFIYFWHIFSKMDNGENFREVLFGKLLLVQLFVSSFYRADFMAPRFWAVMLLIDILYQLAVSKRCITYSK